MNNTIIRRIICFFFSLILSLSLFVISIAVTMQFTVVNKDFLINQLSISGYHVKAAEYTRKSISDLAFVGGVPSDIFDSVVTTERVQSDIYNIFESAYEGKQYSIDKNSLKSEFVNTVDSYASENGIEITEDTKNNIEHLSELCADTYLNCINIAGLNMVIGALKQPISFMGLAMGGAALLCLVSITMLFLVNKYKHKFFRYISYSLCGTFLMITIIPGYFYLTKPYLNLNISPEYIHSFINSFIDDTLKTFLGIGIFFAVLFISALFIVNLFKKRALQKGYNERHKDSLV